MSLATVTRLPVRAPVTVPAPARTLDEMTRVYGVPTRQMAAFVLLWHRCGLSLAEAGEMIYGDVGVRAAGMVAEQFPGVA